MPTAVKSLVSALSRQGQQLGRMVRISIAIDPSRDQSIRSRFRPHIAFTAEWCAQSSWEKEKVPKHSGRHIRITPTSIGTSWRFTDRSFCSSVKTGEIRTKACLPSRRSPSPLGMLSYGTRTRRKPRLLFRLSGVLLFRFEERQFLALLFQLPPRFTRLEPFGFRPHVCAIVWHRRDL